MKISNRRFHIFIITLVVLTTSILAYSVLRNAHDFKEEECVRCHVDADNTPKMLTASISKLCGMCHRSGMRSASHPVDIKPKIVRIPPDLPLNNGILTCNTCHNLHGRKYTIFSEKSNYLRRTAKGRDFCLACHKINPIETGHSGLLTYAHMARKYRNKNPDNPIDSLSIHCIGCHDGNIGKPVIVSIAYGEGLWNHDFGSHPVGVDYRRSRMEGSGLTPMSRLDRRIRFFDGKIGCGTCHNPYSKQPGKLVMSNDGSRLCSECHMDK